MLSVGEIIKKERLNKKLTIEEIEKKIKVRAKYLKAIEENNWSVFSSKIYIVGVLKNYSRFLNLDEKKVLAFFRRDYERQEEINFKKRISSKYLTPETRTIFKRFFFILILFFFFYFGYQLYLYFSPPRVEILSPKKIFFTREEKIKIVGKTDVYTSIFIFDRRIYQNKEGIFEYEFPLKEGENKLIIELRGANGKKTIVEKKFIKKSPK